MLEKEKEDCSILELFIPVHNQIFMFAWPIIMISSLERPQPLCYSINWRLREGTA